MADKVEDKKEYQGVRGRFNQAFEGYGTDLRDTWKKEGGDAGILFLGVPLLGMAGGLAGALVGGLGGFGFGKAIDSFSEPPMDTVLMQRAAQDNSYQALRIRGQGVYMLVHQEGDSYLMRVDNQGEFDYVETPTEALNVSKSVIEALDKQIQSLEAMELPDPGVLSFLQVHELSVLHKEGHQYERTYEALVADETMRVQYLDKLKASRDFWDSASLRMATVEYGLSEAEKAELPEDMLHHNAGSAGLAYGAALGVLLGMGAIPGIAISATNKRRRKRRAQNKNKQLRKTI